MTAANLLAGLVQGYGEGVANERDRLEKEELKKLQIKMFKHDLEQKEKTDVAKRQLVDVLTQLSTEGTALPQDQAGPVRPPQPTQTLEKYLATPQGQGTALQAGYSLKDIKDFRQRDITDLLASGELQTALGGTGGLELTGIKLDTSGKPMLDFSKPKRKELEEKAAVERQSDDIKNAMKAKDMAGLITKADTLLNDASGGIPGTALNMGKRFVGYSDKTTQANEQLNLISGWLVSNVPRMEGSQSEFDVKNYQQMAGMVGDTTVPIGDRKAALQTLLDLQKKYGVKSAGTNTPSAPNASGAVQIKNDADYQKLPSGALFVGPDGKQRRKP